MSELNTNNLIDSIVAEGAKRPLAHPMKQVLLWLGITALYFVILSAYQGYRADILVKLSSASFLLELILLITIAILSAFAAMCLSRPDSHQMPRLRLLPIAMVIPWAIVALFFAPEFNSENFLSVFTLSQCECPWHLFLISAPPGVVIFLIARQGASTECLWTGSMATLAVTSFGYLCMRLIEQNDNPAHLIVWHALPILLMCLAGMFLGKFVLKWR